MSTNGSVEPDTPFIPTRDDYLQIAAKYFANAAVIMDLVTPGWHNTINIESTKEMLSLEGQYEGSRFMADWCDLGSSHLDEEIAYRKANYSW